MKNRVTIAGKEIELITLAARALLGAVIWFLIQLYGQVQEMGKTIDTMKVRQAMMYQSMIDQGVMKPSEKKQ